jgi:hypothetical protein
MSEAMKPRPSSSLPAVPSTKPFIPSSTIASDVVTEQELELRLALLNGIKYNEGIAPSLPPVAATIEPLAKTDADSTENSLIVSRLGLV